MSYITLSDARAEASTRGFSSFAAAQEMRKFASAPLATQYDIFLSHSSEDADVIAGIKILLEREGATVYVYWVEENQAEPVTAATARRLRARMKNCRALVHVSSKASPDSKWMPWELGYFDGLKPGHVAILPLRITLESSSSGQEYLGLYPHIENINWSGRARGLGISLDLKTAASITRFVHNGVDPP